ncbi:rhodanese-like domain-containing protein [Herbaspirillum sp. alder98]|uniref:rhodanese-like domain-containing protein n=1 Tax=Herbaspirillum sp. alder98 TaxID=2913096 RepID=UPI001CD8784F|nr:rhodanese-like domain-containing protein [Herbaspirillum sp. alder98]MCA1322976.1 rhodanese-like domain-containing protein [Herbaspirillum sp. alder98]
MTQQQILDIAQQRGQSTQTPYRGAVTPAEAYSLLQGNPSIKLVDVRTKAERDWVGMVDVPPPQHLFVQWNLYPEGKPNPQFIAQLQAVASPEDTLLFLCRSGVRSKHAATLASEHGYGNCFDILEGFEGNKDAGGHRKTVEGWCQAGLPWLGA